MKHIRFVIVAAFFLIFTGSNECRAQDAFIWVPHGQESQHPGYTRVIGGKLNDGTPLPVCRAQINRIQTSGKYYNSRCLMPWHGSELSNNTTYDIFMTKAAFHWKPFHDLSRAQIESSAVLADIGLKDTGHMYICRRQMQDGVHPGKFAIGYGFCYISWGGKEYHFTDGFDILVR